jgi:hypothetical protein
MREFLPSLNWMLLLTAALIGALYPEAGPRTLSPVRVAVWRKRRGRV